MFLMFIDIICFLYGLFLMLLEQMVYFDSAVAYVVDTNSLLRLLSFYVGPTVSFDSKVCLILLYILFMIIQRFVYDDSTGCFRSFYS